MQELALDMAGKLILFVLLFFMGKLWKMAKPYLENIIIRAIVTDAVKYAQKAFGHLNGETRLQEAYTAVSICLKRWHIYLTPDEIRVFIESILLDLQAEFQEQWWTLTDRDVNKPAVISEVDE